MMSSYFTSRKKNSTLLIVDSLLRRLTDNQVVNGHPVQATEKELIQIIDQVVDTLMEDPVCIDIKLNQPLYIIGDIFGQYGFLVRIFDIIGYPDESRFLFLGNYIDRGNRSIETMSLLFALKLRFPNRIYLLRGNHECEYVSCHYGFLSECVKRYSRNLWRSMMNAFDCMPAVAIIEDCIFCTHSGLIPCIEYTNLGNKIQLRDYIQDLIRRPTSLTNNVLLTHLTWSEPLSDSRGWQINPVGLGKWFGEDVIENFCEHFDFQQIIRSNELLESGYEFMANDRLLTIFTAPCLVDVFKNVGAFVYLHKKQNIIKGRIKIVKPVFSRRKNSKVFTVSIIDSMENDKEYEDEDQLITASFTDTQTADEEIKTIRGHRATTISTM